MAGLAWADLPWAASWEQARKKAEQTGALVMIDFFAEWCGPCKMMKASTFPDKRVIAAARPLVPLRLDAEREGESLAKKYAVGAYPTMLFVTADGEEFWRLEGGYSAPQFVSALTEVNSAFSKWNAAQKTLETDPDDGEANASVAMVHARRGNLLEAQLAANKARRANVRSRELTLAWIAIGDNRRMRSDFRSAVQAYAWGLNAGASGAERSHMLVSIAECSVLIGDFATARSFVGFVRSYPQARQQDRGRADKVDEELRRKGA